VSKKLKRLKIVGRPEVLGGWVEVKVALWVADSNQK
jgi:hypothetical protein